MGAKLLQAISIDQINDRSGRMADHVLYDTWRGMIERCYNKNSPSYPRYGGKEITVHESWTDKTRDNVTKRWGKGFCEFLKYIAENLGCRPENHSLDRIDAKKGYEPGNIRWANNSLQKKNQCIKNTSGYKYVYKSNRSMSWHADYKVGKKRYYVGSFSTKEKAYYEALAHRLVTMWPKD